MVIKNVNILHECKESRDVDRLLRCSMIGEFIDDENKNSIRNPLYIEKTTKYNCTFTRTIIVQKILKKNNFVQTMSRTK
jgi:hypothetical protein